MASLVTSLQIPTGSTPPGSTAVFGIPFPLTSPTSTSRTDTSTTTSSSSSTTAPTSTTSSPTSTSSSTTSTTSSTSTSSTTSLTTTSSSTSSTTSASTTSSSTTSSSSTPSSTSTTPTSSSTEAVTSTSVGNGQTSTVIVTPTVSPAASQSAQSDSSSGSSKGFFNNKGAVAGVFTVVGLVALVIIIAIATNAIRRRRAKKFDDEVAAAAAEAGASPRYPFDDFDDHAQGAGSAGYGMSQYSDPESHGTLSQVPLSHAGESYDMSELSGHNPSYGAGAAAVGAGAAGIGASRSMARRGGPNYTDYGGPGVAGFGASQAAMRTAPGQTTPYNPFAAVPGIGQVPNDPYDPYTAGNSGIRQRTGGNRGGDILEAAGLGGAAGAGAGAGGAYLNRGPSQNTAQTLSRKQSQGTQGTFSPDGSGGAPTQESYAAHYQPDFRPDAHQYNPASAPDPVAAEPALPNPFARDGADDDEAYGADSYFPSRPEYSQEDGRMSINDEEDYGRAGRTLKVANE
ncbi:hypothetical protein DFH11DRAFT_1727246 [Phellopilus nigrolimitatus]|nr:hypothetical protein DFH11DRAFT_1727246 [Phellopilus nigrolimitatus]